MTVLTEYPTLPPLSRREVLRYAGCREADPATEAVLSECIAEVEGEFCPAVCYLRLPITVSGDTCDFGCFQLRSADLAAQLQGCREAVLFCATVGFATDRLMARYAAVAPSRAVLLQAIGAERIEALCDVFCESIAAVTPRFSAGYGDLSLSAQREIFRVLAPPQHIGVCLTDSLLMSPTKSVTAIAGV